MLKKAVVECFVNMAKQSEKSAVWHDLLRVCYTDAVAVLPCLGMANCSSWTSGTGIEYREAKVDLSSFREFHLWKGSTYGLCRLDKRGDSFFVLGAIVRFITPAIGSIKSPSLKLKVEACS